MKPPAGVSAAIRALGSRRGALAVVTAALLAALLGLLYIKTQGVTSSARTKPSVISAN